MKHMILGFIALILIPLVPRRRSHLFGRGLAVVLLAAAFGQIFIGLSKLGGEGIQLSDTQGTIVLAVALAVAIAGVIWIFRRPKNPTKHLTGRCSKRLPAVQPHFL